MKKLRIFGANNNNKAPVTTSAQKTTRSRCSCLQSNNSQAS